MANPIHLAHPHDFYFHATETAYLEIVSRCHAVAVDLGYWLDDDDPIYEAFQEHCSDDIYTDSMLAALRCGATINNHLDDPEGWPLEAVELLRQQGDMITFALAAGGYLDDLPEKIGELEEKLKSSNAGRIAGADAQKKAKEERIDYCKSNCKRVYDELRAAGAYCQYDHVAAKLLDELTSKNLNPEIKDGKRLLTTKAVKSYFKMKDCK